MLLTSAAAPVNPCNENSATLVSCGRRLRFCGKDLAMDEGTMNVLCVGLVPLLCALGALLAWTVVVAAAAVNTSSNAATNTSAASRILILLVRTS